ncbi:hypothetical protein [Sinorhizobium meliloti]|uniref:hypothetical protein n=1 Tax=Rhizobium meliloti TaxID=382 RepID=UPI0001E4A625|nr:hypothetical protein [Sinorhizobium meliloti]AEG53101.1 bacteriophage protein [Sinorhizobium meliloti AK83]MDE4591185.1 hypothetical protein [Sinorhizobium meliloti]SEI55234.1 hypothetical protein SAMN04244575_01002 [Sinorhizobium meliloti]
MAVKQKFNFKLGDSVKLSISSEVGEIVGRAQYTNANPQYLVRYLAGNGVQVESWLAEDALSA